MPTTSPAKASSASARSCAKKNCGLDSDMFLPVRTSLAFMPRVSLPEHSRAKAMRSRWFGSILAWILNTNALMRGSAAWTLRALLSCARGGAAEPLQEIADAEIAQRAAEIDRRQMAFTKRLKLERLAGLRDQRQFILDRIDIEIGVASGEVGDVDLLGRTGLGATAFEQADASVDDVIGAEEIAATADRPGHRRGVERECFLDFVEQLESVAALTVHLVDEGDDGNVAEAADLEQLPGTRFDALGGVDHHDRGIDRGERAIGVFGKVLMARRIQEVEHEPVELESHHRGDDGNAAFALDLHPVGTGVTPLALGLDLPREIDGAAEQQQLFGQRGLAGVGVRDDRKGTPSLDFGSERRTGGRFGGNGKIRHSRACGRETGLDQGRIGASLEP